MIVFCPFGPTSKVTLKGIGLCFHRYVVRSFIDLAVACHPQLFLSSIGSSIAIERTDRELRAVTREKTNTDIAGEILDYWNWKEQCHNNYVIRSIELRERVPHRTISAYFRTAVRLMRTRMVHGYSTVHCTVYTVVVKLLKYTSGRTESYRADRNSCLPKFRFQLSNLASCFFRNFVRSWLGFVFPEVWSQYFSLRNLAISSIERFSVERANIPDSGSLEANWYQGRISIDSGFKASGLLEASNLTVTMPGRKWNLSSVPLVFYLGFKLFGVLKTSRYWEKWWCARGVMISVACQCSWFEYTFFTFEITLLFCRVHSTREEV